MASSRHLTRRGFLGLQATSATASVLAACGGGASPAPKTESKPTEAAKPAAPAAQPTVAPKPAAPAAAATPAAAVKPAAGAPVVVWQPVDFIPEVTSLMYERFTAVSKEECIQLNFEELPSGPASTDKFNAAVQAGTTPDGWRVFDYQTQYWRIQGQTLDITDIVQPLTTKAGGFWQPVDLTCKFQDKWYGVPMAVNCWPMHVRQDALDKEGLKFPKDWTEFREQGKKLTKPPFYYYGMTLGRIDDTNNHFLGMVWT